MIKKILALQIPSLIGNIEENFCNLENYLDVVIKNKEPDFLFLPEVWSVGWYPKIFNEIADDFKTVEFISKLAKKHNVNIFGGSFIRKTQSGLKNSCPVVLRNGELLGYYDKIHLYTPDGEGVISAGSTPKIFEIEGLSIALSICYDIRFPELFRSYIATSNPSKLLVNMSAWPLSRKEQYFSMAASRAIENQSYFLALSQCGEIKDGVYNAGSSVVFDPMGNAIQKLNENRGYIYFSLDTQVVDNVRKIYPNLANKKVDNFGFKPEITCVSEVLNV